MDPDGRGGDDERSARLARIEAMRARGEDPYPVRFDRSHTLIEVREHWDTRIETGSASDEVVRVAGRIVTVTSADSPLKGLLTLLRAVAKKQGPVGQQVHATPTQRKGWP